MCILDPMNLNWLLPNGYRLPQSSRQYDKCRLLLVSPKILSCPIREDDHHSYSLSPLKYVLPAVPGLRPVQSIPHLRLRPGPHHLHTKQVFLLVREPRAILSAVAKSIDGFTIGVGVLLKEPIGKSAENMSMGTSTRTGPGRPVCER